MLEGVKANSETGNKSLYNDNTKRPKLQHTQLGILKTYVFCQNIQQEASSSVEGAAGVMYPSLRIHLKS